MQQHIFFLLNIPHGLPIMGEMSVRTERVFIHNLQRELLAIRPSRIHPLRQLVEALPAPRDAPHLSRLAPVAPSHQNGVMLRLPRPAPSDAHVRMPPHVLRAQRHHPKLRAPRLHRVSPLRHTIPAAAPELLRVHLESHLPRLALHRLETAPLALNPHDRLRHAPVAIIPRHPYLHLSVLLSVFLIKFLFLIKQHFRTHSHSTHPTILTPSLTPSPPLRVCRAGFPVHAVHPSPCTPSPRPSHFRRCKGTTSRVRSTNISPKKFQRFEKKLY